MLGLCSLVIILHPTLLFRMQGAVWIRDSVRDTLLRNPGRYGGETLTEEEVRMHASSDDSNPGHLELAAAADAFGINFRVFDVTSRGVSEHVYSPASASGQHVRMVLCQGHFWSVSGGGGGGGGFAAGGADRMTSLADGLEKIEERLPAHVKRANDEKKHRDETDPERDVACGLCLNPPLTSHLEAVQSEIAGLAEFKALTPAAAACVRWVHPSGHFLGLKAVHGLKGGAVWELGEALRVCMLSLGERKGWGSIQITSTVLGVQLSDQTSTQGLPVGVFVRIDKDALLSLSDVYTTMERTCTVLGIPRNQKPLAAYVTLLTFDLSSSNLDDADRSSLHAFASAISTIDAPPSSCSISSLSILERKPDKTFEKLGEMSFTKMPGGAPPAPPAQRNVAGIRTAASEHGLVREEVHGSQGAVVGGGVVERGAAGAPALFADQIGKTEGGAGGRVRGGIPPLAPPPSAAESSAVPRQRGLHGNNNGNNDEEEDEDEEGEEEEAVIKDMGVGRDAEGKCGILKRGRKIGQLWVDNGNVLVNSYDLKDVCKAWGFSWDADRKVMPGLAFTIDSSNALNIHPFVFFAIFKLLHTSALKFHA
jgi:hypothetical protein